MSVIFKGYRAILKVNKLREGDLRVKNHSQLGAHQKPQIRLYESGGLGLIILYPSGVLYSNQTGGHFCLQPAEEGVFVPLVSDLVDQEKSLLEYFTGEKWGGACANGIDEEAATVIDSILDQDHETRGLSVNRLRLKESHEAWVYVTISPHSDWREQVGQDFDDNLIFGFGAREGVITWNNSD